MLIKEFLIFFVIAVLSQSSLADDDSQYKLKAVYVTIRAGKTETPDIELSSKTVNSDFIDNVKLSQEGRQTIYELGKNVKEYYKSKFDQIKLLSTGCGERRCKASAAVFRKGFEDKDFKKEQAVSDEDMINSYVKEEAEVSEKFYKSCPPFLEEVLKSVAAMWKDKKNDFSKTTEIIKEKLGENYTDPYNLWLVWESYNSMSKPEPAWLTTEVKDDLKKISQEFLEAAFSSKEVRKLSGGYLLGEIQTDMPTFDDAEFEQVEIYSSTLPELEATAAWFSGPDGYYKKDNKDEKWNKWNYMEHGSLIALEIYEFLGARRDDDKQYGVKVLIKNGDEALSDENVVLIKGCDQEICPWKTLTELLKDYTTDTNELDQLCKEKLE